MFLLDANVFIEASRTCYSETIAPAFWDWLIDQFESGVVGFQFVDHRSQLRVVGA